MTEEGVAVVSARAIVRVADTLSAFSSNLYSPVGILPSLNSWDLMALMDIKDIPPS